MSKKTIWYVQLPAWRYEEDIKELAQKNGLKIVDAAFQGDNAQCAKAPKLTLVDKVKKADELKALRKEAVYYGVEFRNGIGAAALKKKVDAARKELGE